MPCDVIVAGHLSLDLLPQMSMLQPDNLVDAGKVFELGSLSVSTGGIVSNTGLALHRLGIPVGLMALIGDDWIGELILDLVARHGSTLGEHIQIIEGEASAYTVVLEPQHQDRTLLTHVGANRHFGLDDIHFDLVAGCKIFHLGYPTLLPRLYQNHGDELLAILQTVQEDLGRITSVDMSLPDAEHPAGQVNWPRILRRSLPYVDIFVPSIEEILFMLRRRDYERWRGEIFARMPSDYLRDLAQELIAMGAGIVGFKLGEHGLYLHTETDLERLAFLSGIGHSPQDWAGVQIWQPAFQVEVVGTTGAGDAAYAGLLAALIRGLDVQACARWACAVAACNIEAADPTSGVLTWEATQARLSSNWRTR